MSTGKGNLIADPWATTIHRFCFFIVSHKPPVSRRPSARALKVDSLPSSCLNQAGTRPNFMVCIVYVSLFCSLRITGAKERGAMLYLVVIHSHESAPTVNTLLAVHDDLPKQISTRTSGRRHPHRPTRRYPGCSHLIAGRHSA